MAKLSQLYRIVLPVVVLVLVLTASAPITSVHTDCRASATCTSGSGKCTSTPSVALCGTNQQNNANSNTGSLESPINLFKNIFCSDSNNDEEQEIAPQAGTLVRAIQALVATLLSTII